MPKLLIGTDEAGYGPNLGPLVITATAWSVPDNMHAADLWQALSAIVRNGPAARSDHEAKGSRLYVADSKQVYSAGQGIESLERPVLPFLAMAGITASDILDLGTQLMGDCYRRAWETEPWTDGAPLCVPVSVAADEVFRHQKSLQDAFAATDVRLVAVRSHIMFAEEFNHGVAALGSKGIVLSNTTLNLVRQILELCGARTACQITCDKHGGRNRYDEIISEAFDDAFVFRLQESMHVSSYRMNDCEFTFRTRAEELMPVALASMVSKYLREILMEQFNQFWKNHVPNLKPTKGYPVDAKRFDQDIRGAMESLQIDRSCVWRNR